MAKRKPLTPLQKAQKRVRDEFSRQRRKAEKAGFQIIGGMTWEQIKDIDDIESLRSVTPETIREAMLVAHPDMYSSGSYETLLQKRKESEDIRKYLKEEGFDIDEGRSEMLEPIIDGTLDRVYNYINSHTTGKRTLQGAIIIKNKLTAILSDRINRDGLEAVARRLDEINWEDTIDAPFDESKEQRAIRYATLQFAMAISANVLTPEEVKYYSQYDEGSEYTDLPHGANL